MLTLAEKPVCVQRGLLVLFDTQAIDQIGVCHYSRAHHAFRRLWRFPVVVEKGLELAGLLYDRVVSETADLWFGAVLTHFSPPWKSRFPATETAVARDSVRKGSYCAGSPSIWCWRDHSAGRSARRTT